MQPARFASFASRRGIDPFIRIAAVVAALCSGLVPSGAAAEDPSNSFVVRGVRVFDGEHTIAATDVLVRDGRIARIGPAADPGLPIIDGTDRTLLPGLIDAHTHTYGDARRDAIRFGVTTELDMFTDWHGLAAAARQRASLAPTSQADLWSAGTLATAPHGHGTEYGLSIPTLTGAAEASAFVDGRIGEGSDYIKIILEDGTAFGQSIPSLDTPTLAALVVAAHARHKLAIAHISTEADAVRAVEAGIDGLAHVWFDRVADPATIAAIQAHGVFVIPTLSVIATVGRTGEGAKLAVDPRLMPFLSGDQTRSLNSGFGTGPSPQPYFAHALQSVTLLHRAGVPLLAGTDAGNPGTTHGATLHQELALLVQAGLTPSEALAAATALPARLFALGDRGRIAEGMRADLLLVEGDPTRDITATRAIVGIWKNGYRVDRSVPAAVVAAAAAPATPTDDVVADFEDGKVATRYGQGWVITTDQLIGGRSTATQAWEAGGADGSRGALSVKGTIVAGTGFAWAGTLFMPGSAPFEPVDLTGRTTLVFKVRGDNRQDVAMIFSGPPSNRVPSMVPFRATPEWSEVRIALDLFPGIDLSRVRGLAFTATPPAGDFSFEIDDVSIR